MPSKTIFTALLATLAILLAPGLASAASTSADGAPSKAWSKGPVAKASCPVCIPITIAVVRSAVTVAAKTATKKGAASLTRAASSKGVTRVARPVVRTSKKIKAGRERVAQKVLTASIAAHFRMPKAIQACVIVGTITWMGTGSLSKAHLACATAAAGKLL